MQDKLVIYLHNHDPDHPDWAVFNAENVCRYSVRNGNPADLTAAAAKEIIVIVPAEDVLITFATLPKMIFGEMYMQLPMIHEEFYKSVNGLHTLIKQVTDVS